MLCLQVPVWDDGLGDYVTRKVAVTGCLAHIGDTNNEPQFRLYLSELMHDGRLRPIGVDSITNDYLPGFLDQIQRLYQVLISGGERNWAGTIVDFSKAKEVEA